MVRLNVSRSDNIFDTLPPELREHVFSYAQSQYIWKLKTADARRTTSWKPPHDKEAAMAMANRLHLDRTVCSGTLMSRPSESD